MYKKLIAIFAIAIFAVSAMTVLADTWVDKSVPLQFTADPPSSTSSSVSLGLFQDCAATIAVASSTDGATTDGTAVAHNFGLVMQGNYYEWTFYVLNSGAQQVYLSYLPTTYTADGGQTKITIAVNAIEYGVPCQMTDNNLTPPLACNALPYALPEKNVATPTSGFLLMPTKMVKLDVIILGFLNR